MIIPFPLIYRPALDFYDRVSEADDPNVLRIVNEDKQQEPKPAHLSIVPTEPA